MRKGRTKPKLLLMTLVVVVERRESKMPEEGVRARELR